MELATLQHTTSMFDEDFFHLVMDHNPHMVFVKNEDSVFVYANKTLFDIFAPETRHQIIGYKRTEEFSEEQRKIFLDEDRKAFELGSSEIIEEITDYRGFTRTFMTRKICFTSKNGQRLMLGIGTDITELAKRERQLVETNNTLENFAAIAAHDLRSPLCTYASLLELVRLDKETYLSEKSKHYLTLMNESTIHLTNHISGLLNTYKAMHGNKLNRKDVDLNLLLERVKFNLSTLINSTDAKILSNRLPVLNIDETLFHHMLMNLIENSIKYRSEQNPIIIIKHKQKNETHTFSIEDNGIGISPSNENKVFALYGQAHEGKNSGVGLGLSLCKEIAQLHNGKMWIDHSYTKGCRICFTIENGQ